jgi:Na+-transporting NADH:ubiquinone oxidoreductase subunit F
MRGRVPSLVDQHVTADDAPATEAYLCGSRGMIDDTAKILRAKGIPEDRIHFENFY